MTHVVAPDGTAEAAAFDAHRVELTAYCYRMLGSAFEAEDAVQETMVRAWRGRGSFEGRSSVRAWLYRIATNVCLDILAGRSRRARPAGLGPPATGEFGRARPESTWLQPVPDAMVLDLGADPADVAVARASVRLAFVAALQHLPPRQRAVLILRDVLRWSAADVAALLDTSETAVHSALARARATLGRHGGVADTVPDRLDDDHRALLDRYVDAFERYDVDSLVALLHEDATLSMPPITYWFAGRAAIEAWWRGDGAVCRGSRLVATRANGRPAFGQYHAAAGGHDAFAIVLLDVDGGRITGIETFIDPALFKLFGLPAQLPR
jgi:RNA polymerase sigma-70 factor (ECF subfamily)